MGSLRFRFASTDGLFHPADADVHRFIYAFWHECLLFPVTMKTRVCSLISKSGDGELIARACLHLGIKVVRGSDTDGGAEGLMGLWRHSRRCHLGITPDGPRGPRRRVKAGVITLALRTGLPILPCGIAYSRAWRMRSLGPLPAAQTVEYRLLCGDAGRACAAPPRPRRPGTLSATRRGAIALGHRGRRALGRSGHTHPPADCSAAAPPRDVLHSLPRRPPAPASSSRAIPEGQRMTACPPGVLRLIAGAPGPSCSRGSACYHAPFRGCAVPAPTEQKSGPPAGFPSHERQT